MVGLTQILSRTTREGKDSRRDVERVMRGLWYKMSCGADRVDTVVSR